jgi:hypothetical protein
VSRSKDGLIDVEQVSNIANVVFPPASWSVINLPTSEDDAKAILRGLYNSATTRHISLAVARHRRKDRLEATGMIRHAIPEGWGYLDTVNIFYEKPSSCSNNGLLPVSEVGFVLYKGSMPAVTTTAWFSDGLNNATNLWNIATQKDEGAFSYFQKFSWEVNMLLMSLSSPIENSRFIYGLPLTEIEQISLFKFCEYFGIGVKLYVDTQLEVDAILKSYEKFSEGKA